MKRKLPPLKALVAFEAAANAKSFSDAAEALSVTQGAISKQIKLLEEQLQTRLFERRGNSIQLTSDGNKLLSTTAQALDTIEKGTETFYQEQKKEVIIIDMIPSLSALWMLSRVEKFQNRYPTITLQLNSSDNPVDAAQQQSDLAIRCLHTDKAQPHSEVLFVENLKLIASPKLLEFKSIKRVDDIYQHRLLKLTNRPQLWQELFAKYAIKGKVSEKDFSCEHFYMLIQAVIEKLGLALVPDFLCEDLLQKGKLVNPLDISIKSQYAYYFISPPYKKEESRVIRFKDWFRSELTAYL